MSKTRRGSSTKSQPATSMWTFIGLGALAVIVILVYVFALNPKTSAAEQQALEQSQRLLDAERAKSAADAKAMADADAATIRVTVIGDSYTTGSQEGGNKEKSWAHLVEQRLNTPEAPVIFEVQGLGGSGYVSPGSADKPFQALAEKIRSNTDIVVVFGSLNDRSKSPQAVQAAATKLYETAAKMAPDAKLLVIGPQSPNSNVSATDRAISSAVATAAKSSSADYLDPIAAKWFFTPGLIGADGVHPTDQGHVFLADQITPFIQAAVAQVTAGRAAS